VTHGLRFAPVLRTGKTAPSPPPWRKDRKQGVIPAGVKDALRASRPGPRPNLPPAQKDSLVQTWAPSPPPSLTPAFPPLFKPSSPVPVIRGAIGPDNTISSKGGSTMTARTDIYERITTDIVTQTRSRPAGPWHQPWNAAHAAGGISRPITQ